MRATRVLHWAAATALLLAALGASPAPQPSPAPTDAAAIFDRVRTTWGGGAYPRFATYATIVEFHVGSRHIKRSWDTVEDLRHSTVFARKFSREELASPPDAPRGINIALPFFGTLNKPQEVDPVGHVAFAIDQDYGMAPNPRKFSTVRFSGEFQQQASTLPVIGRTATRSRDYDVRLIETLTDDRGPEYHLALTPLRDPKKYRLRELWVDGRNWVPEEAVVSGIGNRAPLADVPWRVEYRQIDGATYIARETALSDVDYGKAGVLHWVNVWFDDIHASANADGWRFMLGASDDNPETEP